MAHHKTVIGDRKTDSGGDGEQGSTGRKMTKGMKNSGPGLPNGPGPKPFAKKMGSGRNSGHKLVDSKDDSTESGQAIDEWCQGKRSSYK